MPEAPPATRGNAAVAALLAALVMGALTIGLDATLDSPRTLMSPGDYALERAAIGADTRAAITHCRGSAVPLRALCRAEAYARDRIAKADLEARYYGTDQAAHRAHDARVRARQQLARARCAASADAGRRGCIASTGAEGTPPGARVPLASS